MSIKFLVLGGGGILGFGGGGSADFYSYGREDFSEKLALSKTGRFLSNAAILGVGVFSPLQKVRGSQEIVIEKRRQVWAQKKGVTTKGGSSQNKHTGDPLESATADS